MFCGSKNDSACSLKKNTFSETTLTNLNRVFKIAVLHDVLVDLKEQKMIFRLDVDKERSKEPSLAEMTAKAVELLEAGSEEGFLLFVESALIDKVAARIKGFLLKSQ